MVNVHEVRYEYEKQSEVYVIFTFYLSLEFSERSVNANIYA